MVCDGCAVGVESVSAVQGRRGVSFQRQHGVHARSVRYSNDDELVDLLPVFRHRDNRRCSARMQTLTGVANKFRTASTCCRSNGTVDNCVLSFSV